MQWAWGKMGCWLTSVGCRYVDEFLIRSGYVILYNPRAAAYLANRPNRHVGLFTRLGPLGGLPVLDASCHRVESMETLVDRGISQLGREYGHLVLLRSPGVEPSQPLVGGCLLDEFTSPLQPQSTAGRRKYLLYEPHGSWMAQIDALQKAMVLAAQLDRTLIMPPFVHPEGVAREMAADRDTKISDSGRLVDWHVLFQWEAAEWVRTTPYEKFPFRHFYLERNVLLKTRALRYDLMLDLDSPIMDSHNVTAGQEVMLPVLAATDQELLDAVGGCRDTILTIRNFNTAIEQVLDPQSVTNLSQLRSTWGLSSSLEDFVLGLRNGTIWPANLTCTIFSRGNGKIPCGMDIFDSKEKGLLYYRSCQAGPARLAEYALEGARAANITAGAIYLMRETSNRETLPPEVGGTGVKLYTVTDLAGEIIARPELGIPPSLAEHLAGMLERELCRKAALFVNNLYSPLGTAIAEYRGNQSLPVQTVGMAP